MAPSDFAFPPGHPIRLDDLPTETDAGFGSEDEARAALGGLSADLVRHQLYLMAHETYGLLVLFQGMDASGKDEAIQHVLASTDPRGVEFKQFKRATPKELRHDYLWRAVAALPARGQLGVFNRSYYEHVVAERVHPETLDEQNLPEEAKEDVWAKRYRHLNHFEQYLVENGIYVLKVFMHVSKEVQRQRLLARIEDPDEQWQFSTADVEERGHWDDYMRVYGEVLTHTNTAHAPWYVVPADEPWAARAAVATLLVKTLRRFHDGFPEPSAETREALDQARARLEQEDSAEPAG
jgi:PPK2 family polyphosphate:nucleotide phosphotransferase